jgi:hypothetical protein
LEPIACGAKVRLLLERLTAGAVPVPLRVTVCVPTLSTTFRTALLLPGAPGVNEMLMLQVVPAATLAPHVLVAEKSELLVPATLMLVTLSARLPAFARVMTWRAEAAPTGWFGKVRLAGDNAANAAVPVPDSATLCVPRLSVRSKVADRVPNDAGVKMMLAAQLAPAARFVPQVFVCEKSPAFTPLNAMEAIGNGAVPVFCTVTTCGALDVATGWLENVIAELDRLIPGAAPMPVSVTVLGLPGALLDKLTVAVLAPAAPGANDIVIRQLLFTGRVVPLQPSFTIEKSAAFKPAMVASIPLSAALPRFVTVSVF